MSFENASIEEIAAAVVEADIRSTAVEWYKKKCPGKDVENVNLQHEIEAVLDQMHKDPEFKERVTKQMETIAKAEKIGTPNGELNKAIASGRVGEAAKTDSVEALRTPPSVQKPNETQNLALTTDQKKEYPRRNIFRGIFLQKNLKICLFR